MARGARNKRGLKPHRILRLALSLSLAVAGTVAAPERLAEARTLVRDTEIEATLRRMSDPLFKAADLQPQSIEIFILGDPSLNAFVDGGRNMFLHTGLLTKLETPEQLMGVIAHETGHISAGHILRRIEAFRNARIQSIITQLIGIGAAVAGGGQAGIGLAGAGQRVAERNLLRFTRGQEASADQASVLFLERVGVDPVGTLEVLRKLEAEQAIFLSGVDPYALTHPLSSARIRFLESKVAASPMRGRRVEPDMIYWHGRMRAKLEGFLSTPGAGFLTDFDNPELRLYRDAIRLHRRPDVAGALAAVDKLIETRPRDPYYWELKGQILRESGRGPEAVAPYQRAVALAPEAPLIRAALGEALLSVGDPAKDREALAMLEQAAVDDPFDPGLRRPLALAYARSGNDGMAAVVTSERLALQGRLRDAKRQAARAKTLLPVGSPGWLRAEDVVALTDGQSR